MSTVFRVRPYGQRLQEPPKSWGTRVSSGGIAIEASDTAGALLLLFWILPLLRLLVELFLLSYSLRQPLSLVLGVLFWI